MPRRKKKRDQGGHAKNKERSRKISEFWSQLIKKAEKVKEDYLHKADQAEDYLRSNHEGLFTDPATAKHFMDFKGACAISIPKVAQMRGSLGPRLYPAEPKRKVTSNTSDGVMVAYATVQEEYLNYTAREANSAKQYRKAYDDGFVRGRCFLLQEIDPVRNIVTSRYASSRDVLFDPDYFDIEEAKWVAVRRREPLWETERRVTEKWRIKNLGTPSKDSNHATAEHTGDGNDDPRTEEIPITSHMVEYWTILSKMGVGWRGAGMEKGKRDDSEDFVRLEIVVDHDAPLAEGKWEVPFFLDADWPMSYKDFIEPLDHPWPESIVSQVLPCQRGVDLLSSLKLTSCKNRERLIVFADSELEDFNQHQLRRGTAADMISVKTPPGKRLSDMVFVPNFGEGSRDVLIERQFLLDQMDQTTGVTPAVSGMEAGPKDRSATATISKNEGAMTRVNDLEQRGKELAQDAARKEAIITRLVMSAEDIAPYVPAERIGMYYVKVTVPGQGVLPVRDLRSAEEIEANPNEGPLSLQAICPSCSDYFIRPEEAFQQIMYLLQAFQESEDPRILELAYQISSQGVDESGIPLAIDVDVVTVERVWEDTAGLTPEEIMREFSYSIGAGSGIPMDKDTARASADQQMQTVLPIAQALGDVEAMNQVVRQRDEAYDIPEEERVEFMPPPPPMPEGQPGGDQ